MCVMSLGKQFTLERYVAGWRKVIISLELEDKMCHVVMVGKQSSSERGCSVVVLFTM